MAAAPLRYTKALNDDIAKDTAYDTSANLSGFSGNTETA
jgi:hypothetical protein